MERINRREALRRTAMVMGTALSATTIAGIMQGCSTKPELAWTPVLFDEDQASLITMMAETIIPRTGTPGARDVGVPAFIEQMVKEVYSENEREQFMTGMNAFSAAVKENKGSAFVSLDPEEQTAYLEDYNTRMQESRGQRGSETGPDLDFFSRIKELTVAGFFTSEAGATQVLQYKAIPVEYHGCISLEEAGGKTWAP